MSFFTLGINIHERHQRRLIEQGYDEYRAAIGKITSNAVVRHLDILEEPVGPAGLRTAGHCLCSITSDREAHCQAVSNFFAGMEAGDVALELFDVNSSGYTVGGVKFPGYPTNAEEVSAEAASMGLTVIDVFEMPVVQPSGTTDGTGSSFSALGAAVLLKETRFHPTTILL